MKLILAAAALAALSTPAYALTLDQAMNELAGMYCSGSSCTSDQTIVVDNPDIVTSTPDRYVSTGSISQSDKAVASGKCTMGVIGQPGVRIQMPNVDANCTALSIASTGSGYTVRGTTTVTDGGTTTTCETTTKTLSYNGPNTSRDTAWSVSTSSSETAGGC